MDVYNIVGITGSVLILIAFLMNQFKLWNTESVMYDFVNFVGSLFLVIYAVDAKAYPFIVLNTVWALVSLKDLLVDLKNANSKKY